MQQWRSLIRKRKVTKSMPLPALLPMKICRVSVASAGRWVGRCEKAFAQMATSACACDAPFLHPPARPVLVRAPPACVIALPCTCACAGNPSGGGRGPYLFLGRAGRRSRAGFACGASQGREIPTCGACACPVANLHLLQVASASLQSTCGLPPNFQPPGANWGPSILTKCPHPSACRHEVAR